MANKVRTKRASAIRYQANALKSWLATKRIKAFTARSANTKLTTNPTAKGARSSPERSSRYFTSWEPVAANMIGTARKKENSVATWRERPNIIPPMIVAPDRDVPGRSAEHGA